MLFLVPLPLAAQTTLSVDFGSSRVRFADSLTATAVSITPTLRAVSPQASFSASGTFSQLSGASTHAGVLDASLASRSRGVFSGEVEGIAGGSLHSDGTRTGQMLALARLHVAATSRGIWVGGGLGRTWDGAWRGVLQGDAGVWVASGPSTFAVTLSPTVVEDTIRYADTFVAVHHELSSWELDGSVGHRAGSQIPTLPANRRTWGSVGATFWATPRLAIAASAGTYPVDFTQGFPGGEFLSLSVRLRSSAPVRRPTPARPEPVVEPVRAFEVRRVSAGTHRLRILAPNARSVELFGDFTQWTPVPLTSEGRGWWTTTLVTPSGTHEINVRVDRGPWLVPPGLATLEDEFGGAAGLLVIPE
jgi:hypothetical protein